MSRTAAGLSHSKLPSDKLSAWRAAEPHKAGELAEDRQRYAAFWQMSQQLLRHLPRKPDRNAQEAIVADTINEIARESRERFLRRHVEKIYAELTRDFSRFIRVEELVFAAADAFPGLVPTREQIAAEAKLPQAEKEGLEIDQGLLVSHVLAYERSGNHLCHAMLLPRPETEEQLGKFGVHGVLDLGPVQLERRGKAVHLTMRNPRYLNAEDQTTIEAMEIGVDVAILDPESDIAVLRGDQVEHAKYRGRHVFGSGINLTHLYRGRIPFIWFLQRDLGFVHKFMRGVAQPDVLPDDVQGYGVEKPWISVVESFAIGGHCQILLTQDYVLAADDAFMTLPARKEGIIPGVSNMRLPRFTGDRLARQLIQYERKLLCDSPEGRLICDEIAPAHDMDAAVERVVAGLTNSGAVSAVGNRRAFRVTEEPLDAFRRYCAVYAREQAYCHFSPALIANLERHWNAQNRKE
jgi:(3,5-dihydroxyphenyl)acetyl-CoA 1,2-dioxygenase